MANKVTKMEWSSSQLDYVKEFLCNTEEDVALLPACCMGSRAYVCESGIWYVCGADQTWKPEEEAIEEGGDSTDNVLMTSEQVEENIVELAKKGTRVSLVTEVSDDASVYAVQSITGYKIRKMFDDCSGEYTWCVFAMCGDENKASKIFYRNNEYNEICAAWGVTPDGE